MVDQLFNTYDNLLGYDISLDYLGEEQTNEPSWNFKGQFGSYVGINIGLRHNYHKFIYIYYIPTYLFTITSWMSFIIPPFSYPARYQTIQYDILLVYVATEQFIFYRTTLLVTVFLCQIGIFTSAIRDTPIANTGLYIY